MTNIIMTTIMTIMTITIIIIITLWPNLDATTVLQTAGGHHSRELYGHWTV